MTPYFFKQMRKRTGLCLVVVLTALAFSLALCMLQRLSLIHISEPTRP